MPEVQPLTAHLPAPPPLRRSLPRPFLKWVGGKSQLLEQLWPLLPDRFNTYFEPFVGGGALYFALRPAQAVLFDLNLELVDCYQAVQSCTSQVISCLQRHRHDRGYYYRVRAQDPRDLSLPERAARTIFLNRTGFNGLYRVNKSGRFNVPFGSYIDPVICHEENLRACAETLSAARILHADFESVLETARAGDLVYFDPPYVPLSRTSDFTAYNAGGFTLEDHVRLKEVFAGLTERGVYALLSNSDTHFVRELYRDYHLEIVQAARAINSRGSGRGRISEVVVRNFPLPRR